MLKINPTQEPMPYDPISEAGSQGPFIQALQDYIALSYVQHGQNRTVKKIARNAVKLLQSPKLLSKRQNRICDKAMKLVCDRIGQSTKRGVNKHSGLVIHQTRRPRRFVIADKTYW